MLVVLLAVAGYAAYRLTRPVARAVPPPSAPANMQITQLTTSGTVQLAAISPDGRYVAYVEQDPKGPSLWLRQVATGSNVQIIPPAAGASYSGLTFTPDGNYLDYVEGPVAAPHDLYRVPVLGGQSTKLLEDLHSSPVTFSGWQTHSVLSKPGPQDRAPACDCECRWQRREGSEDKSAAVDAPARLIQRSRLVA